MAIQGFSSRAVEKFFVEGIVPKRAPGNRLEALKGDLLGFQSIRINDQWRVIFRWTDSGPTDVDIRDYH